MMPYPGQGLWLSSLILGLLLVAYLWLVWQLLRRLRHPSATNAEQENQRLDPNLTLWGLLSLSLCLAPLVDYWSAGYTGVTLLGLLPYSDAAGWLYGTLQLASTGTVDDWTARRPLNALFLYSQWLLAAHNLVGLLLLRAVLLALALTLFCLEVARSTDRVVALVAALLLALFAYSYTPTLLTESNGLIFGLCAFALFLRATSTNSQTNSKTAGWVFAGGLFFLSLALLLRMGAFGVLPTLLVWWWLHKRFGHQKGSTVSPGRIHRWPLLPGIVGIAGALLLTAGWTGLIYSGDNSSGANFAYTLYGLTHGGEPWQLFFEHFPELTLAAEPVQASAAYDAAWQQFTQAPLLTLQGLLQFFANYWRFQFSWAPGSLKHFLLPLFLFGVLRCLWTWRHPTSQLLLSAWLGVLATTPIIYWSANAARALIVTAPIEILFIGIGLASASRWVRNPHWWRDCGAPVGLITVTSTESLSSKPGPHPKVTNLFGYSTLLLVVSQLTVVPAVGVMLRSEPGEQISQHQDPIQSEGQCKPLLQRFDLQLNNYSYAVELDAQPSTPNFWPQPRSLSVEQFWSGQQQLEHPVTKLLLSFGSTEAVPLTGPDVSVTLDPPLGQLVYHYDPAQPESFHYLFIPESFTAKVHSKAATVSLCARRQTAASQATYPLTIWQVEAHPE